ncbi:uncharacterized protein [Prorops nasuta]|uniref:uncharacterized protein n=1 Tax=Prorops nasuta TaxID=863751 RepID=UPI0034CDD69F
MAIKKLDYGRNYSSNFNFSVKLNRWVMKFIGVWPKPQEASTLQRIIGHLKHFICYSLLLFFLISGGLVLFLDVHDIYHQIRMSGPLSFLAMAIVKYYTLVQRENEIRLCIESIEDDWRSLKIDEDHRLMISNVKFGRKLMAVSGFFMYGGALFFYVITPFVIGRITAEDGNYTYLPLAYPVSSLIVDTRYDPANTIVFTVQGFTGLIVHSVPVACCSLTVVFVMHICGRIDVVISWLDRVDLNCNKLERIDEMFGEIITHHARTLSFIDQAEYILREISFVEVVGCTLNMCFLSYYTLKEYTGRPDFTITTYLVILSSMVANIFILCYIGEILVGQCTKVGEMSYMIDWYKLPKKRGLNIILMMAMSSNSTKSRLTAGNIMDLSLSRFGDV